MRQQYTSLLTRPARAPRRLREMVLRWLPVTTNRALEGDAAAAGASPIKAVLRSKGFLWMSHSHATAFYWSHAGQHFEIRDEGDWRAPPRRYTRAALTYPPAGPRRPVPNSQYALPPCCQVSGGPVCAGGRRCRSRTGPRQRRSARSSSATLTPTPSLATGARRAPGAAAHWALCAATLGPSHVTGWTKRTHLPIRQGVASVRARRAATTCLKGINGGARVGHGKYKAAGAARHGPRELRAAPRRRR